MTRTLTSQAQNTNTNTTKNSPSLINISPQSSTGKIQTINASNLSAQQQRILLQNLKQQSVHFKTVQILSSNATPQQQGSSTVRLGTAPGTTMKVATPIVKTTAQHNKTVSVVASQAQNIACLLKASNALSPQQQQQNSKEAITNILPESTETRTSINDSTGQIISLEGLLSKQGKTLRVTNAKAPPPQGSIIQLTSGIGQHVDNATASQYTVVSQPRNVITVGTPYQLNSSQANSATAVFTTSIPMSVAPKYITTSGKIVTSSGHHVQPISAQTVLNSSIFGKTTVVPVSAAYTTSGTGGLRVISTGTSANFNIANIQGKQVILSSKPSVGSISSTASQTQKNPNPAIILGGQTAKLHGNVCMNE